MSQNNGLKKLRVVLVLFSVAYLFYGVSFLFFTSMLSEMSGDPVRLGWIRWSGAPLFALGIGAVQAFRDPVKQGSFITIATVSALLIACALLYSRLFEWTGAMHEWFILIPFFINLGLFVLLLWARQGAKGVLG